MKGTVVSTNDSNDRADDTERLLHNFFRSERPQVWPEPPWRRRAVAPNTRHSMRGKSVLVAALVVAAVGLSFLGEPPSSWPGSRSPLIKSKMEASRPSKLPETKSRAVPQIPKDARADLKKR
jgi:hypothetical protein